MPFLMGGVIRSIAATTATKNGVYLLDIKNQLMTQKNFKSFWMSNNTAATASCDMKKYLDKTL